jgi:hypothetical protein
MSPDLPAFPAPPQRQWTAARQQEFLELLADSGSVTHACRRVGMSRQAAYRLRRHPDAADFRRAWDLALADANRQIEDLAIERALHGEEEVIERDGLTVVVRRRPCDARLLVHLLKRADDVRPALASLTRQLESLRQIIDALPDRATHVAEPASPQQLDTLARLPPPLREIHPDNSQIEPEEEGAWLRRGRTPKRRNPANL